MSILYDTLKLLQTATKNWQSNPGTKTLLCGISNWTPAYKNVNLINALSNWKVTIQVYKFIRFFLLCFGSFQIKSKFCLLLCSVEESIKNGTYMMTQERGIGTSSELGLWGLGLQSKRQNAEVNLAHYGAVPFDRKVRR